MKKKKINLGKININVVICIIVIIFLVWSFAHLKFDCWESEPVCYKTECNFWGCKTIEVDLDSPQCEIKEDRCTTGVYYLD